MLIGFGCTVPAVMSTRTLPSERDRRMTILLTPFMSCSAKLPIYAFFVHAFFPKFSGLVMTGLYLLGILVGILVAMLYRKTLFKGDAVPFVMELPNYRLPGARNVGQLLWEKAKDFLQRAFSVIFIASIVIWFLSNFNISKSVETGYYFSALKSSNLNPLLIASPLLLNSLTGTSAIKIGFADGGATSSGLRPLRGHLMTVYKMPNRISKNSKLIVPNG